MTRALYTPGPWLARREFTSLCIVDDAGDYIADIHDRETYDENLEVEDEDASNAESEANARLIAAAPDMLKALKRFTKHGFFHAADLTVEDFVFANAAIAKAEQSA